MHTRTYVYTGVSAGYRETALSKLELVDELKKCGNTKELQRGKILHSNAIESGCHKNRYVAHTLISMYSKCGSMQDARVVFENTLQRDVVSWNVLLLGYVENGESLVALEMFNSMDCTPNGVTFLAAFKALAALASAGKLDKKACLQKGLIIHRHARMRGFDRDVRVASTLVDMYGKCGSMVHARDVLDGIAQKSVVAWTALILGYVENGESLMALEVFNRMDCAPNRVTFMAVLKACAKLDKEACLRRGVTIHRQAREHGLDRDVVVASVLVEMYSKCGAMQQARDVFDRMPHRDVVCWTTLILGYVENGESMKALDIFHSMECAPDSVTFIGALKACAGLDKDSCLQAVHRQAKERGFDKDTLVANTLIDVYSKCGSMVEARDVFDGMTRPSVVSWNVLISGYVENGETSMALEVFNSMDCVADCATFVAALRACASLGAVENGQGIHYLLCKLGFEQEEIVANCLVDFYGKCGNMNAAEEVFNRIRSRDLVSWNALIGGYSLLGETARVFGLVKGMQDARLQVDVVTMVSILTACNHAGTVEEGERCFYSMSEYGVTATMEHYTCMVDMLGRANRLQEALSLVRGMPFEANSLVWMTLLGACKKWSNVEVGEVAFRAVVTHDSKEHIAAAHVLMRNIYERLGMLQDEEHIENAMF